MKRAARLKLTATISLLEGLCSRTMPAALTAGFLLFAGTTLPTATAQAASGGGASKSAQAPALPRADKLPGGPSLPQVQSGASLPTGPTVCQGSTLIVPIDVAPANGAISMDFDIRFNPAIILPTNVVTSAITTGCRLD